MKSGADAAAQGAPSGLETIPAAPVAIVVRDRAGAITYLNPQAEQLFGWSLGEIIEPVVDADGPAGAAAAAPVPAPVPCRVAVRRRDGTCVEASLTTAPCPTPEGGEGTVLVYVPVAAAEQERHGEALLREVHHRVKNNLQGVANLLTGALSAYPALNDVLHRALSQIKAVASVHGLLASEQRRVDLAALVRETANAACGRYGASLAIRSSLARGYQVVESEAVPLSLVLNELFTNALKHASPVHSRVVDVVVGHDGDELAVDVRNAGDLRASVSFEDGLGLGDGLRLVAVLLPPAGARLRFIRGRGDVVARLRLGAPVVVPYGGTQA